MQNIARAFWGGLVLLTVFWIVAEPTFFRPDNVFALRGTMTQYSGIVAIAAMSVAMVLALRPRPPERWFGGLDKMYRLHKWLGITALAASVIHWLWIQAPKWAVGWGLLARPQRGTKAPIENPVEAFFSGLRHPAEGIGEWAFYAATLLMVLALIRYFPYRLFYKTHRLLAVGYLALVFHAVVLMDFDYWTALVGWVSALMLAGGTHAAVTVLFRRVGADRKAYGTIRSLHYFPGVHTLEVEIDVPEGWPGHKPGQFAFATSDPSEGPHPYTIASGWDETRRRINFIAKELGDHTRRLKDKLRIGQEVVIEGPYGCFTFDDDCPRQIWVGGGIGITPFIARMKHLAIHGDGAPNQTVHLFHSTSDVDTEALEKLSADAEAVNVRLHILVDKRDGFLTCARIREAVPEWRDASIWFCGPAGFGEALKKDFAEHGFPVEQRFHRELFSMR